MAVTQEVDLMGCKTDPCQFGRNIAHFINSFRKRDVFKVLCVVATV